jgi:hypothetical protein
VGSDGFTESLVVGIVFGVLYFVVLIAIKIYPFDNPVLCVIHLCMKMVFTAYVAGWMLSGEYMLIMYLINMLAVKLTLQVTPNSRFDSLILLSVVLYMSTLQLLMTARNALDIPILLLVTLSYSFNLK